MKRTSNRLWNKNNPEKMREARRRYRMNPKNREKVLKQKREWSQKRTVERRRWLQELREWMGGRCSSCGYNEDIRILQFHHLGAKDKAVSMMTNRDAIISEAQKCILLCPNCHAKEHLSKNNY